VSLPISPQKFFFTGHTQQQKDRPLDSQATQYIGTRFAGYILHMRFAILENTPKKK
jgi:hypothetical protein